MSRIVVFPVTQTIGHRQVEALHAHDHHLGHLICAIRIEVRVVGQCLRLVGPRAGRIVHQSLFTVLVAQRLKKRARHVVELDDRHMLTLGHGTHSIGIIAMGLADMQTTVVECASLRRRDKDNVAALGTHPVYIDFQHIGEIIPGATARRFLLLVVVAELTEHIIARTHHRQNLVETVLIIKRRGGESALSVI